MDTHLGVRDERTPHLDERIARQIVAPYVDADLIAVVPSQNPTPDFALYRDNVRVGWFEVTTATDEDTRRLNAQLDHLGRKFTTDRLKFNWVVLFRHTADLRRLAVSDLVESLAIEERIEARGASSQTNRPVRMRLAYEDIHDSRRQHEIRERYGVAHTYRQRPSSGKADVHLGSVGHASYLDPSQINRRAEVLFDEKREQLRGRDGDRHVFAWVDMWDRSGAGAAMHGFGGDDPEVPDGPPSFPDWVTDVWLMPTLVPPRLWHCSRNERSWETFDIDMESIDIDEA